MTRTCTIKRNAPRHMRSSNSQILTTSLIETCRRSFPGTSRARQALDFGCGTGRSTRFLRQLGFDVVGFDSSVQMLQQAWSLDPAGNYQLADARGLKSFCLSLAAMLFAQTKISTDSKVISRAD